MGLFSVKKELEPNAEYICAELSWDIFGNKAFDLDISAFLLNKSGKAGSDNDFVFYNNGFSDFGAVSYGGDNRTGDGDGADENIMIRLKKVPSEIERIVLCVSASDGYAPCAFCNVKNACLKVNKVQSEYDKDGENLASIDLTRSHASSACLIVCELIRSGNSWMLALPCDDVRGGLSELCERFGLEVE